VKRKGGRAACLLVGKKKENSRRERREESQPCTTKRRRNECLILHRKKHGCKSSATLCVCILGEKKEGERELGWRVGEDCQAWRKVAFRRRKTEVRLSVLTGGDETSGRWEKKEVAKFLEEKELTPLSSEEKGRAVKDP